MSEAAYRYALEIFVKHAQRAAKELADFGAKADHAARDRTANIKVKVDRTEVQKAEQTISEAMRRAGASGGELTTNVTQERARQQRLSRGLSPMEHGGGYVRALSVGEQTMQSGRRQEELGKLREAIQKRHHDEQVKQAKNLGGAAGDAAKRVKALGESAAMMQRGALRASVAKAISSQFGGGAAGGLAGGFIGAMGGVLASAIAFPIAWAVGDALMQLPGKILSEREESGRFGAGGGVTGAMEQRLLRFWGAQGNAEGLRPSAEILQDVGIRGEELEKRINQILILERGGGERVKLAAAFAKMHQRPSVKHIGAVIGSSMRLRTQLIEDFGLSDRPESLQEDFLKNLPGVAIGPESIKRAMDAAANDPQFRARLESQAGSWSGRMRAGGIAGKQAIAHPITTGFLQNALLTSAPGATGFLQNVLSMGAPRALAKQIATAMAGSKEAPDTGFAGPLTGGDPVPMMMRSRFTSASGLAESMQTMWRGGGQIEATNTNTTSLQQLTAATEVLSDIMREQLGADAAGLLPP